MPHIHLETTADLPENADVPDILRALVDVLSGQESVAPASVKAYHSLRSNWATGEGSPEGMAHCTVSILAGRSPELRRAIAEAAFEAMKGGFAASLEAQEVAVSLELREMDPATYLKVQPSPIARPAPAVLPGGFSGIGDVAFDAMDDEERDDVGV